MTGVQTCALPISLTALPEEFREGEKDDDVGLGELKDVPVGSEGYVNGIHFWRTPDGAVRVNEYAGLYPVDGADEGEDYYSARVRRTATGVEVLAWLKDTTHTPPLRRRAGPARATYMTVDNPDACVRTALADGLTVTGLGDDEVGYVHATKFRRAGTKVYVRKDARVHQRNVGNCVHLTRTDAGVQVLAWPAGVDVHRWPSPDVPALVRDDYLPVDNPRACGLHTPVTPKT